MSTRRSRNGPASRLGGGTTLSGQYDEPIQPITPHQSWAAQQTCLRAARAGGWSRADIETVLAMLGFPYRIPKPPPEEE